jgi:hypothetical protein
MRKYEFTGEEKKHYGLILKQIRRISDGEIGGWIEKEENLSHGGNAWVYKDALVFEDAKICEDAKIYGNAWVYGNAKICEDAKIYGEADINGGNIIKNSDYIVFKNNLTSGRYYTYNFTNDIWIIGCFSGDTESLKGRLKENGNDLQKIEYNMAIEYVNKLKEIKLDKVNN